MIYYKCHKVNFRSGGSYIDSPYWIKNKKQQQIQKIQTINIFNTQQLVH